MAILWHKENNIWSKNTNLHYKMKGSYKRNPTYYKYRGIWHLISKSSNNIEWSTSDLIKLKTVDQFNAYVNKSFKDYGLVRNSISNSNTIFTCSESFGISCQYGISTSVFPILFSTGLMPLPNRVVLEATMSVSNLNQMSNLDLLFLAKDIETINGATGIITVGRYWPGSTRSESGFWINSWGVQKKSFGGTGNMTYRFDIKIPKDVPNCNLNSSLSYHFIISNITSMNRYACHPLYISYLLLEFNS